MTLSSQRLRLTLELVSGAEPITGSLTCESGAQWTFTGWVELALAIEEALSASYHAPGRGDQPPA